MGGVWCNRVINWGPIRLKLNGLWWVAFMWCMVHSVWVLWDASTSLQIRLKSAVYNNS
jgi:hypothetical protein